MSLERTDFNRWRGNVRLFGCRHNFRHRLAGLSQYHLIARLNLLDQFGEPAGKLIDFRSFNHRIKISPLFRLSRALLRRRDLARQCFKASTARQALERAEALSRQLCAIS
jgi:hypothetical protein